MAGTVSRTARQWLSRHVSSLLLVVTGTGLAAGGILHMTSLGGAGDMAWIAAAACGPAMPCGRWRTASASAAPAWT